MICRYLIRALIFHSINRRFVRYFGRIKALTNKAMTESSPQKPISVLCLEDNENDRELLESVLTADGLVCDFLQTTNREEFEAALARRTFDLIISDFTLPSYDGMRALAVAQKVQEETPFIFLSGTLGEERAIES